MNRNPIYVTKASMPPFEEYLQQIAPLWESAWLTNNGALHKQLTQALETRLKVPHLCLFANGHLALSMAIRALHLKGEVITTPFTFASTTHAIVENGLKPVFCDIDPQNYTMNPEKLTSLITDKTCAILPVHVYGNVCDVDAIETIAKEHGLHVLYDAAHAFGVEVNGRGIGTFGDASMFSFHATKVYHTVEGGAITFADPALDRTLYHLKNFGISGPESVDAVGSNAKMGELHAAMGLVNLRYIDEQIRLRQKVAERYRERLSEVKGLRLPPVQSGIKRNDAYFPVLFDESLFRKTRDEVFAALATQNIHARKYFYPLVSDYACYRDQYDSSLTPVAQYTANRILTLPIYGSLALADVDRICDLILQIS